MLDPLATADVVCCRCAPEFMPDPVVGLTLSGAIIRGATACALLAAMPSAAAKANSLHFVPFDANPSK